MILNDADRRYDLASLLGLVVAGLFVAAAIIADGSMADVFNGIGGIVWIASAVQLFLHLRSDRRFSVHFAVMVGIGLILVVLAKPDDFAAATVGFGCGGALLALITGRHAVRWALLLAAMWLPLHLTVAVVRAAERAARDLPAAIRREPPPTAALVPLSMILAAWLGAQVVMIVRDRRSSGASSWTERVSQ